MTATENCHLAEGPIELQLFNATQSAQFHTHLSFPRENRQKTLLLHITTVPECLWSFLWGQIGFMKEQGFEIQAVSSPGEMLDKFAAREQVTVHAIKMLRKITPWKDRIALFQLWSLMRKLHPQIVHSHTPKGGLFGMVAAWIARVPVRVYTIHGLPLMTARGFKRKLLYWTERIACLCATEVLSVSPSIREVAIQEKLCPAAKIKVICNGSINGVDTLDRFNPIQYDEESRCMVRQQHKIPSDALVVGFVGRIVRDKGMVELADAWRLLREEFPELHLLLVGPIESQDPVPQDVETLFRTDPRIHLVGYVTETSPYYAAMDICVLPTYREGLGLAALEANAMRLPVVATSIPGCVDAVANGVTGLLVPPRDTQALAGALRKYITSPYLRRKHGQAGRDRVMRDFQPEMIWEELYQEYIELLHEKGLPGPSREQLPVTIPVEERRAA